MAWECNDYDVGLVARSLVQLPVESLSSHAYLDGWLSADR